MFPTIYTASDTKNYRPYSASMPRRTGLQPIATTVQPQTTQHSPVISSATATVQPSHHPHEHHHEAEKTSPKTPTQRLASLGTGALMTSAITLLAEAEQKTGALKNKSSALLSTDVGTWVKSLGLLVGVQGINAGLGLQMPPVLNALELGAASHVLIPGTLGARTAHFLTMAPLLAASVGVTQAAHSVIDTQVDKQTNWTDSQQTVAKSLLGLGVSVGAGIGAMALFPKVHLGLASLGVKLHPNTASAQKQAENWYITTTKTVDGLAYATQKSWQGAMESIGEHWQKLTSPKTTTVPAPLFNWEHFKENAETPWSNPVAIYPRIGNNGKIEADLPETKLYRLQKIDTRDLTLYRQPSTPLERVWHLLTGNQSATAHGFLNTGWDASTRMPIPSSAFADAQALKQFEAAYTHEISHVMRGEAYANAVTTLKEAVATFIKADIVDDGNTSLINRTDINNGRKMTNDGYAPFSVLEPLVKEALVLQEQLLSDSPTIAKDKSPLLLEYNLFQSHYQTLKPWAIKMKGLKEENDTSSKGALKHTTNTRALQQYFEALRPFFELQEEYDAATLKAIKQHAETCNDPTHQHGNTTKQTANNTNNTQKKWESAIDSDLHTSVLLTDWINGWKEKQPTTVVLHPNATVDKLLHQILTDGQQYNAGIGTSKLANDLSIIKERYLPLIKKLNEQGIDFRDDNSKQHFQQQVLEQLGKQLGEQTPETTLVASRLTELLSTVDHIKFHIPDVPTFWAITGAAAGAVTCGNGCCSGSFFCLNEATALLGSLVGTLFGKKQAETKTKPTVVSPSSQIVTTVPTAHDDANKKNNTSTKVAPTTPDLLD
jgi:hypothetical protein